MQHLCSAIQRRTRWPLGLLSLCISVGLLALGAAGAGAQTATDLHYGQVAAIGGFDSAATYTLGASPDPTTGLTPGKLVYPVGMAVAADSTVPGGEAIYVLDLTNPQLLANFDDSDPTTLSLTYRIQKLAFNPDGTEDVVASTTFTLQSNSTYQALFAQSLAVDASDGRVYVLIDDDPDGSHNAAQEIDAWATAPSGGALVAATGSDLSTSTDGTTGAQFVGPATLQTAASASGDVTGDLDAVSLAVDGTGSDAPLAVGGQHYTSSSAFAPEVEQFSYSGIETGTPWTDANAAVPAAASSWAFQPQILDALSANPDGTLNVTLGLEEQGGNTAFQADEEPDMATLSYDAGVDGWTTTPVLPVSSGPWSAAPTQCSGSNCTSYNDDISATYGTEQDPGSEQSGENTEPTPWGGGNQGTLAPSVIQLSGDGSAFPKGLYAGLVVQPYDHNDDANGNSLDFEQGASGVDGSSTTGELAWLPEDYGPSDGTAPALQAPSSFGIRVFDSGGDSIAMVGNEEPGGACNIQGGDASQLTSLEYTGSMMALQAGVNGSFYALVQPDLGYNYGFIPYTYNGQVGGDEVIEFAPGSGTPCPDPQQTATQSFTVTNASQPSDSIPPSGTITVQAGTQLHFDAGYDSSTGTGIDLDGGVPWSYDWSLGDCATSGTGSGGSDGTADNTFVPSSLGGGSEWAQPTQDCTYSTAGTYTATLNLVSDWGTSQFTRTIKVTPATPPTASFSASATPGTPLSVTVDASGTGLASGDAVNDYHWDFGDGQSEDTQNAIDTHTYAVGGTYTVTLTVTDVYGSTATAMQTITVIGPPTAALTANPSTANTGQSISFDASGSKPADGSSISSYSWNFGDGATDTTSGPTDSHTFGTAKTYTVTVTVTDADGQQSQASTQVVINQPNVQPPPPPPVLTGSVPTISGTPQVGDTLTGTPNTWTPGTSLTYQWYAGGAAIPGATQSTLTLTSAEQGKAVTLTVTGTLNGKSVSETSAATSPVAGQTPSSKTKSAKSLKTATPKISGTAKVGKTLKVKAGSWTKGTKLTYQWFAGGKAIKHATKTSLKLVKAEKGKKLTVKVTGKHAGYTTATKTSRATKKVAG